MVLTSAVSFGAAVELTPNFKATYSHFSQQLRKDLLNDYDRFVPPTAARAGEYSQAGTDVEMSIKFFKVQEIDAAAGAMELKIWLRMTWSDTRLSWDPAAYGGITKTHMFADPTPTSGSSELWIPDVQSYNCRTHIVNSLDPAMAQMYGSNPTQQLPKNPLPLDRSFIQPLRASFVAPASIATTLARSFSPVPAPSTSCASSVDWSPFPLTIWHVQSSSADVLPPCVGSYFRICWPASHLLLPFSVRD